MPSAKTLKRRQRNLTQAELLERIERVSKLDNWNSFIEEISVPGDMAPALLTGRPELLRIVQPRPLTIEECAAIYKLVMVLIETNMALREHAETVAHMVNNMMNGFTNVYATENRIDAFANFRQADDDADDE